MNVKRNPRERLEALLMGLEDDVMRGEGCVDTDVAALRAEIEDLVDKHTGVARGERQGGVKPGDASGKAAGVVDLLRRWTGIGQEEAHSAGLPRLRMAFSSKRGTGRHGAGSESPDDRANTRPRKDSGRSSGSM